MGIAGKKESKDRENKEKKSVENVEKWRIILLSPPSIDDRGGVHFFGWSLQYRSDS